MQSQQKSTHSKEKHACVTTPVITKIMSENIAFLINFRFLFYFTNSFLLAMHVLSVSRAASLYLISSVGTWQTICTLCNKLFWSSPQCSGDPVLAVNFSQEDNPRVVVTGKNSIVFWTLDGDSLKKRTGIFGKTPKPKYVTAVSHTSDGSTISGDTNGNLIIWKKGGPFVAAVAYGHN